MKKTKEMCVGCYENFYNQNREGGCWSFPKARVVTRMRVGTWDDPPYIWTPTKCLSCYRPQGYSMLSREDCRVVADAKEAEAFRNKYSAKE